MRWPLALAFTFLLGCSQSTPEHRARAAPAVDAGTAAVERTLSLEPVPGDTDLERTIARWQAAVRRDPRQVRPWIELSRAFVRKARASSDPSYYRSARDAVDHALAQHPDDVVALQHQALTMLQDHQFREVVAVSRRVIARNAQQTMSYGLLGDALLELGDYAEAERAYQRMVDLRPAMPSYLRAGWMRWMIGDPDGAVALTERAIGAGSTRMAEELSWSVCQLGQLHLSLDNTGVADQQFQLAAQLFHDQPGAWLGRGRVAMAEHRYADAVGHFRTAEGLNPSAEAQAELAEAFLQSGNTADAATTLARLERTGRRLDPRALSVYYADHDQSHDDAVALAREEYQRRPDEVFTEDALAWALHRAGNHTEAWTLSERSRRTNVPDSRLSLHGGLIANALGHRDDAIRLLDEGLQLNGRWPVRLVEESQRALRVLRPGGARDGGARP